MPPPEQRWHGHVDPTLSALATAPCSADRPGTPGNRALEAIPEPAKTPAQATAHPPASSIAVVSLRLGRRREPRHWLLASQGDPAGLAARLQGSLAAFTATAPSGNGNDSSSSPLASVTTSAPATTTPRATPPLGTGAASSATAAAGPGSSLPPGPGARPQNSSQARTTTTTTTTGPLAAGDPELLLAWAFRDGTVLARADVPDEASYRYQLSLPSGRLASASLACWRRYSPGGAWQRRCGPMGLAPFLAHHGRPPADPKTVHLY